MSSIGGDGRTLPLCKEPSEANSVPERNPDSYRVSANASERLLAEATNEETRVVVNRGHAQKTG
jgi:hypothetical protein